MMREGMSSGWRGRGDSLIGLCDVWMLTVRSRHVFEVVVRGRLLVLVDFAKE